MADPGPQPDCWIDLRGESCPFPVMHTLDTLAQLAAGSVLEVVSDCTQAFRNVPEEADIHGYDVVSQTRDGPEMRFRIIA